jgi:hypothetical protein
MRFTIPATTPAAVAVTAAMAYAPSKDMPPTVHNICSLRAAAKSGHADAVVALLADGPAYRTAHYSIALCDAARFVAALRAQLDPVGQHMGRSLTAQEPHQDQHRPYCTRTSLGADSSLQ